MPASASLRVSTNVAVPMRDGVTLYADLFLPPGDGPFPALLQRTPYNKTLARTPLDPLKAAENGFAVVIQDTRGRHQSEGVFYTFRHEQEDGYDTVEWVAAQPWCTGKVGMYGASYVGATQWLAAMGRPPHLAAIMPRITASNTPAGTSPLGNIFVNGTNETGVAPTDPTGLSGHFQAVTYIGAVRDGADTWWDSWTCSGLIGRPAC